MVLAQQQLSRSLVSYVALVLGIMVAVALSLANTASAQGQGWNDLLLPAEEDCLARAQNVAAMCGSVMQSNDPFDLLNCCTEAQSVNEQRCFCQADVALGLGTSYDLTIEVLQAGCNIPLATYGSVDCVASNLPPPPPPSPSSSSSREGENNDADVLSATNPVAFWTFDDDLNSNVASDGMGNVNGLYSAEVDKVGQSGPRSAGSAAYFNGFNSYIVVPYTPLLNSADFTISANVNPSPRPGQNLSQSAESIVENFAETSQETVVIGGYGIERHWVGPDQMGYFQPVWAFVIGTPIGPTTLFSSSRASNDKWAQVSGTYDSATRRASIYVDGNLEESTTLGNQGMLGNPENDMLIGNGNRLLASGGSTSPYNGYISQVVSFDTPLDAGEMAKLYSLSFSPEKEKTGFSLPKWGIFLIAGLSVMAVVGVAAGLLVWRLRSRARSASGSSSHPHTTPRGGIPPGPLPDNLTPLHEKDEEDEEKEQLTPKAKTPSASLHPRFKKIGSRISVTWN
jgi:hypothetical protein